MRANHPSRSLGQVWQLGHLRRSGLALLGALTITTLAALPALACDTDRGRDGGDNKVSFHTGDKGGDKESSGDKRDGGEKGKTDGGDKEKDKKPGDGEKPHPVVLPTDCDKDHDGSKAGDDDCAVKPPTPHVDCDKDTDGSGSADSDCATKPPTPQVDCDKDTDASTAADCAPVTTPGGGTTTPGGGGTNPVSQPVTGVEGAQTTVQGVQAAAVSAPAQPAAPAEDVLGASTSNPNTGFPILNAALAALVLLVAGMALLASNRLWAHRPG